MLRIPHCLDNRLTDGGKFVSPTHPLHFTPQKHYYCYVSGTHFTSAALSHKGNRYANIESSENFGFYFRYNDQRVVAEALPGNKRRRMNEVYVQLPSL
jgi:hypothetical protein